MGQPADSPATSQSYLDRLPAELKLEILDHITSFRTLHNLILAIPTTQNEYFIAPSQHLQRCISTTDSKSIPFNKAFQSKPSMLHEGDVKLRFTSVSGHPKDWLVRSAGAGVMGPQIAVPTKWGATYWTAIGLLQELAELEYSTEMDRRRWKTGGQMELKDVPVFFSSADYMR